jgi:hypothetical protein
VARERVIGQHHVERLLPQCIESGFGRLAQDGAESGKVQERRQHVPDVWIVFDDEDAWPGELVGPKGMIPGGDLIGAGSIRIFHTEFMKSKSIADFWIAATC